MLKVLPALLFGAFYVSVVQPARMVAQANIGGGLRGTVTDKTGAGLPSGTATLTNTGTGVVYKSTITSQGEYSFSSVPPALYTLTVTSQGFQERKFSDIVINLNETKSLAVALDVVGENQTVQVSAETANIVTQETSVTGLFTEEQIKNLPLNGRDYQNLIYLSPGITRAASGSGQGSGMVAAGTRPTNNNFLIDGGDANDPSVPSGTAGNTGTVLSAIPIDALGEFTVISSNASAEFGRSSGAVVNVVSKSGTNTVHGTVWEFIRNSEVNTRGFFDPVGMKSPFKQNQFGFRYGAPLWKDHTFMAGAYEGFRQRASANQTLNVPTAAEIAGITDPALKALFSAVYPAVAGAASFTKVVRSYTNNLDGDTGFVRFDQNFSSKNQAFLTGSILDGVYGASGSNVVPGAGYGETLRPYHFVLSDNHIYSPQVLNVARVTFQRQNLSFPGEKPNAAMLQAGTARTAGPYKGMPYSANLGDPNGIPTVSSLSGIFSTVGVASNFPQGRASNVITYQDSVTVSHGNHEFKFGGEIRRTQENGVFSPDFRPAVTVDDSTDASFLKGAVASQTQYFFLTGSSERGFRQLEQGYFAQDSWRISPQFTLEYGVRYENFSPFAESKNLIVNAYVLDSNNRPMACQPLPFGAGMSSVALVNPTVYGIKPFCTDNNNFGPRIGFSYDLSGSGKTVIRGAYGVFYDRIFDNVYGNSRFNAPQVAPITSSAATIPYFDGSQATGTISTTQVYSPTTIDPHLRTPYTTHFNLTLSRELDANTSLTVAYVGGLGTKLLATERPNFGTTFPTSFRPTNQGVLARSQADINAGIIRGPFSAFSHRTSNASSNFHSLEVSLKRRTAFGLSGQLAYTFAHSMDNISDEIVGNADSAFPQATLDNLLAPYLSPGSTCPGVTAFTNLTAAVISSDGAFTAAMRCATGNNTLTTQQAAVAFNANYVQFRPIGSNYGDSSFDVRQRLAVNLIYELPFGRGKQFASGSNRFVDAAVGGWHVGSIIDTQTGTPYLINAGVDANRDGDTNDRAVLLSVSDRNPTLVKNFKTATPTVTRFQCDPVTGALDPVSRSRTCAAGSGTVTFNQGIGMIDPTLRLHRGSFREPGIFNWDAQLFKNFKVREKATVRLNVDAFNVLNHANLGSLGATMSSSNAFANSATQRSLGQTLSRQLQAGLKVDF